MLKDLLGPIGICTVLVGAEDEQPSNSSQIATRTEEKQLAIHLVEILLLVRIGHAGHAVLVRKYMALALPDKF